LLCFGLNLRPSSSLEELYQQMLAKALAHYFEAKILLLDPTDFLIKVSLAGACFLQWG
jgi:hypothetical protein